MVYLKLQPQTSIGLGKNLKLSCMYYGPYQVISGITQVAYKLLLSPDSKVHPVFHVSYSRKKLGTKMVVQTNLPTTNEEGQFFVKPVAILQRQLNQRGNIVAVNVLIQWSNLPHEDASWEDYDFLKKKLSGFDVNP